MHQNRSPATYSITWYRAETLNGITELLSGGPKSTFLLVGHISLHVTSFLIYREIILGEYYELLVTSLPQRRGRIYQPAQYQSKGINPPSTWHSLELCSPSLRAESWSWFILSSWYIFTQLGRTASSGANQDLACEFIPGGACKLDKSGLPLFRKMSKGYYNNMQNSYHPHINQIDYIARPHELLPPLPPPFDLCWT